MPQLQSACPAASNAACFWIVSDPDFGVLPRVLNLLARRNLMPKTLHSRLSESRDGMQLSIDIQVDGLLRTEAATLAQTIRQFPTVKIVVSGS